MVCACTDENPAGEEGNEGYGSTEGDNTPTVSNVIVQMNRDVADMQQIAEGKVKVLTCMKESNGRYLVELDNGHDRVCRGGTGKEELRPISGY